MLINRKAATSAVFMTFLSIALAGCSNTQTGDPVPSPGADQFPTEKTASSEPSTGTTTVAPRVAEPLDATQFLKTPCSTLSNGQLATFDVKRDGVPTTTGAVAETVGPYCSWQYPTGTDGSVGTLGVGFLPGNEEGLTSNYRSQDEVEYFTPTEVQGYPAVFTDRRDRRTEGDCNIVVGISDSLTFRAWESGPLDAQGACERAKQVAEAALVTIRDGDG